MTTTAQPLTVAEAVRRRDDAKAKLTNLTSRLTNGDTSVTHDELNDARAAAEHAELQIEGAKAAERRLLESELREASEAFRPKAEQRINDHLRELGGLADDARQTLRDLLDGFDRLARAKAEVHSEWKGLHPDWIAQNVEYHALPPAYRDALPATARGSDFDKAQIAAGLLHKQLVDTHTGNWRQGKETDLIRALRNTSKAAYDEFIKSVHPDTEGQ